MNEEALVADARAGNVDAFGELVDLYGPACYRLCFAVLRSHADAEDAAQETFLKAWRQLPRLREASAWPDWIRRIALRTAIDSARRGRAPALTVSNWTSTQPDLSLEVTARDEMETAFTKLSAADRAILVFASISTWRYLRWPPRWVFLW